MEPNQKIPVDLLDRYLAGVRVAPDVAPITVDARAAWERLSSEMDKPRGRMDGRMALWWATIACVLIAFVTIKYLPIKRQLPQTKTYTTANAQRATVTLSDGSEVILAPATTIHANGRNIELSGEAIFTVNQHNDSPFIVKSGNTITRVLGTTFGIRAYDNRIRVAVSEGRVSVNNNVLSANDIADVSSNSIQVTRNTDVSTMLSFATGNLIFRATPLRDAIPDLNRWYDVDIHVTDPSIASMPLTAEVSGSSVRDLVRSLSLVLGLKARQEGRVIYLGLDHPQ